ncbi:unnamed protein product [Effrenium voratum]|uniref:Uncharacterized protein n=1 Tax=Effrenium voratum TaxID=2562239 RepID=A0AA36MY78_9DINO|nr:unnamed protein product [Effrenium voratum]
MAGFNFQQMGGRCKMVSEEDAVSLLTGDIIVLEVQRKMKQRREQKEEQRRLSRVHAKVERQKELLLEFLKQRDFQPRVNAPKLRCFGLLRSYPLQQAVLERRWDAVQLLLRFGAEPKLKDSFGRSAFDMMPCQIRDRFSRLHERILATGTAVL